MKEFNESITCQYFKKGKEQNYCRAYPWGLMVPSIYEEMNFCHTFSFIFCCWHKAKERREEVNCEVGKLGLCQKKVEKLCGV